MYSFVSKRDAHSCACKRAAGSHLGRCETLTLKLLDFLYVGFFLGKNLVLIRSPSLLNFFASSAKILIPCDIRINCCRQL